MKAENGGRQMKTVWRFGSARGPETAHGRHPTQKPLALLSRLIRATQLGRRWLGIDTASHWLEVGTARYHDLALDSRACDAIITCSYHGGDQGR